MTESAFEGISEFESHQKGFSLTLRLVEQVLAVQFGLDLVIELL